MTDAEMLNAFTASIVADLFCRTSTNGGTRMAEVVRANEVLRAEILTRMKEVPACSCADCEGSVSPEERDV